MSTLMALPGCGIPTLRGPEVGPTLPDNFDDANNSQYYRNSIAPPYYPEEYQSETSAKEGKLEASAKPRKWLNFPRTKRADTGNATQVSFTEPESAFETDANDNDVVTIAAQEEAGESPPNSDVAGPGDADPGTATVNPAEPGVLVPPPDVAVDGQGQPAEPAEIMMEPQPELAQGQDLGDGENSSFTPLNVFFNDPILANLIDQALVGNQELKILTQEIQIAGLEVQARTGAYLPFVNLGAGAGIDKPGQFTRPGAVEDQLQVRPGRPFPEPLPDFLVAANVSWEIDIWRKLRNERDAAAMRYFATRDGQNYIVTRLVAEIADNYYELLSLDNRLMALDQTIAIQEQSLKVAEAKKEAARGTELAVQRFQAEVHKNKSEKLIIHQQIIEVENRVNFLLGRYPQRVDRIPDNFINLNLRTLAAGVPADLLLNRSDIREAERELQAAGLDVQAARARFYPSLTLTAGVGYNAFNPKYLFTTPESLIYNVAGDLVAPLINKRAIRADYLSANAKQLQSVYNYQRTVLNAFTEVINRMAKVQNYGQSIEIKKQQLASLEASVSSASQLFQNARAEYVEVLLAQRDLMDAKMVLIETKKEQLGAIVNAYQALGGGGVQLQY